jgi:hypothetical protein
MFLHSERIEFREPDGRSVVVAAPLPDDLRLALAKILRFGAARSGVARSDQRHAGGN